MVASDSETPMNQQADAEREVDAMYDIPHFIKKAQDIYGYPHFVNDVGGSLCELDEPGVMDILVENTLILYIQVTNSAQEQVLIWVT